MSNKGETVNSTTHDLSIVVTEGAMLNNDHMYEFQKLLGRQSNFFYNMQNTLCLQTLDLIVPIEKNKQHIQILFSGYYKSGHWICTYYDGKSLYIFDSLNKKYLNDDQRAYLIRLYPSEPPVVFTTVDQQPLNSLACGIYAIAFATSLFFNIMPDSVNYYYCNMRNHLMLMFKNNSLSEFPFEQLSNSRSCIVVNDWNCLLNEKDIQLKYGESNFSKNSMKKEISFPRIINKINEGNIASTTLKQSRAEIQKSYRERQKLKRKIDNEIFFRGNIHIHFIPENYK